MKRTNLIIIVIRIILATTCLGALYQGLFIMLVKHNTAGDYFVAAITALLSLFLTIIPDFLKNKDIMMMPMALQTIFTVITFCAMFLGEILNFYVRFFWWDIMLHISSGFMFAMVGFVLSASLNRDNQIRSRLNPVGIVLFCVCFSLACGALWEIFEFCGDAFLGMNMQRWKTTMTAEQWLALRDISHSSNPGLMDTMKDIIDDTIGAIASIAIIIPFTKRDNKYTKAKISVEDLLREQEEQTYNKKQTFKI